MNQQKNPAGQSSSQVSCPVQTTETAYPVDSTPHSVNCPVTVQPLLMENGNSRVGRMYQHVAMDKGPQNPKTTLPVGLKIKIYMKKKLFLDIYNKLVTYNSTKNIIKTLKNEYKFQYYLQTYNTRIQSVDKRIQLTQRHTVSIVQ
jgi:hypothetical protein